MDLFEISSAPLSTYPTTGLIPEDVDESKGGAGRKRHQNLVRILQHAASLRTRILPLAWEPALEQLGPHGATGSVNQQLLNSQYALAFKRFKSQVTDPRFTESQFRDQQYDAMVNELTISSCPAIQEHPNITQFVCLCFEPSPVAGEVWPMLTFLKFQSDLEAFTHGNGDLNPVHLLDICRGVAEGISVLHKYGVVHGDIKPGNVLVSQASKDHAPAVALSDFGFSRFAATDDDPVKIFRSEPWEAPEWSRREFTLRDAKKLDMYSFGLLCLWLFFRNESLSVWDNPHVTVHMAFTDKESSGFEDLQFRKHSENAILKLSRTLLARNERMGSSERSFLEKLFELTLENDLNKRASTVEKVLEAFPDETNSSPVPESSESPLPRAIDGVFVARNPTRVMQPHWHGILQMESLFWDLDYFDIRVHFALVKSLTKTAEGEGCDVCVKNAAFQSALCHTIGFGVDAAEDKISNLLRQAGCTTSDTETAVNRIKASQSNSAVLSNLFRLGYRNDIIARYRRDGLIANAIDYYRRSTATRDSLFGKSHSLTLRAKDILVHLLKSDYQIEEARDLALDMLKVAKGLPLSDQVAIKELIADLFKKMGGTDSAIEHYNEILQLLAEGNEDRISAVDDQQELVQLLLRQGDHDKALKLAEDIVKVCLDKLGSLHSSTRNAKRALAAAYDSSGQLELALEINEDLVKTEEIFSTKEHLNSKVVQDLSRIGLQYYRLGKRNFAIEYYKKAQDLIKADKRMAIAAANTISDYATDLVRQGNLKLALTILEPLLQETIKIIGLESWESAMIMGNLAYIYSEQKRWGEAETLERQVVDIRRKVLGSCDDYTIVAMGNLRQTLLQQGKFQEAATLGEQELLEVQKKSKSFLWSQIKAAETVADSLESAGAFIEAIPFYKKVVAMKTGYEHNINSGPLSALVRAVICSLQGGQLPKMRELLQDILYRIQKDFQEDLEDLISQMLLLSEILLEKNLLRDAEVVVTGTIVLSQMTPPITESLKREVTNTTSLLLERKGMDEADLVFDPSILLGTPFRDQDIEQNDMHPQRLTLRVRKKQKSPGECK